MPRPGAATPERGLLLAAESDVHLVPAADEAPKATELDGDPQKASFEPSTVAEDEPVAGELPRTKELNDGASRVKASEKEPCDFEETM